MTSTMVALVALLGATTPAEEPKRNALQADLGLAVIGVAYERVLTNTIALQLEGQFFALWWADPRMRGWGGQIRPTIFPFGRAPGGLYVAPFLRIDRVTDSEEKVSGAAVGYSAGAFVGYSFLFGESVNLRLGAGAQYIRYRISDESRSIEWKKPYPGFDIVLGWMF